MELMISLSLTDEQVALADMARKFARNEIVPISAKHDRDSVFPLELYKKAHELGLMTLGIPPEYNGSGLGVMERCIVCEELAYGCAGITMPIVANTMARTPIVLFGSDEQKKRLLIPHTKELRFASYCLPNGNVSVKMEGENATLNGEVKDVLNAHFAEEFLIYASSDGSTTAFIVPKGTRGVHIGNKKVYMGLRACNSSDIWLEDVVLSKENIIGNVGNGRRVAELTEMLNLPLVASCALGIAKAGMEHSLNYSMKREQFGQPIFKFEATQIKIADMLMNIEASRLLIWKSAWMIDRDEYPIKEALYAKCFATDTAMSVSTQSVQIFGGYGYTKDYPVEKLMRDAKMLQVFPFGNDYYKLSIARKIEEVV